MEKNRPKCLFLGTDGYYEVKDFEPRYVRSTDKVFISPNMVLLYDKEGSYNSLTMLNGDSFLIELDEKSCITSINKKNVDNIEQIMKRHHREKLIYFKVK